MKYDIQVTQCRRDTIEATLKAQANQGWQLVSCWPEADKIIGVFQRPLPENATVVAAPEKQVDSSERAVPAKSSANTFPFSLDTVLKSAISEPIKSRQTRHILSVKKLAESYCISSTDMLSLLEKLGLDVNPLAHQGYNMWLYQGKSGWYVNAEKSA